MRRLVCLLLLSGTAHAQTLVFTPHCEPGSALPTAVDVELTVRTTTGRPHFRLADRVMGDAGVAGLISGESASDTRGPVPLRRLPGTDLDLEATRAVAGPVTFRYRARSVPAAAPQGPRFGLRHDATGIGGQGAFFLVAPDTTQRVRIGWGRGTCPSFTTYGSLAEGALDEVRGAVFLAGRPKEVSVGPIRAAWFGAPAFDVQAATEWAARVYEVERTFFGDRDPAPYQLWVRVLGDMGERANGMGQQAALFSAVGPKTTLGPALKRNLAHEMLHRWIGLRLRIAGPEGTGYWFSEGFTVYYAPLLLFRGKILSADEMLGELNFVAARYFSNPHTRATNEEIRRGFFENPDLAVVPYLRGALYAAELDAAIRRHSSGRRSLDDLIRNLRKSSTTPAAFRDAVRREAGTDAARRFDAVIQKGETPDPPSDAYGPCFRRVARDNAFEWSRIECGP
jgi:hypothetical protein